jgi:DNA invertase Pin-like site-specific DNA recombinase
MSAADTLTRSDGNETDSTMRAERQPTRRSPAQREEAALRHGLSLRGRILTERQIQSIRDARRDGVPVEEACRRFGIHHTRLRELMKESP